MKNRILEINNLLNELSADSKHNTPGYSEDEMGEWGDDDKGKPIKNSGKYILQGIEGKQRGRFWVGGNMNPKDGAPEMSKNKNDARVLKGVNLMKYRYDWFGWKAIKV